MTTAQLVPPLPLANKKIAGSAVADAEFEPTIGRTMAVSIAWTGAPMWLLTGQVWDGLGLGAFCAFWGGPGFGTMVGGAIWTSRNEAQEAEMA